MNEKYDIPADRVSGVIYTVLGLLGVWYWRGSGQWYVLLLACFCLAAVVLSTRRVTADEKGIYIKWLFCMVRSVLWAKVGQIQSVHYGYSWFALLEMKGVEPLPPEPFPERVRWYLLRPPGRVVRIRIPGKAAGDRLAAMHEQAKMTER